MGFPALVEEPPPNMVGRQTPWYPGQACRHCMRCGKIDEMVVYRLVSLILGGDSSPGHLLCARSFPEFSP